MADQSLQYLQQIIQDVHSYVAHEPDPQAKATAAKCLQAFLTLQHQKMQAAQAPSYGTPQGATGGNGSNGIQQVLQALGGGNG